MPTVPENDIEEAYNRPKFAGAPYSWERAKSIGSQLAASAWGEARRLFTLPGRSLRGEATPEEIEMFGPQVAPLLVGGGGLASTRFAVTAERSIQAGAKAAQREVQWGSTTKPRPDITDPTEGATQYAKTEAKNVVYGPELTDAKPKRLGADPGFPSAETQAMVDKVTGYAEGAWGAKYGKLKPDWYKGSEAEYLASAKFTDSPEGWAAIKNQWDLPDKTIADYKKSGFTPQMAHETQAASHALTKEHEMWDLAQKGQLYGSTGEDIIKFNQLKDEIAAWKKANQKPVSLAQEPFKFDDFDIPGAPKGSGAQYKNGLAEIADDAEMNHYFSTFEGPKVGLGAMEGITPKQWMEIQNKYAPKVDIPESAVGAGFNPAYPIYKGGRREELRRELSDPSKKDYERGHFFSDDPKVADAYGYVHEYVAKPKNPAIIDVAGQGYSSSWMETLIEHARDKGHDLLIVRGMHDIGTRARQNQVIVLDASIVRHPTAKFDPDTFHMRDVLAGVLATIGGAKVAKEMSEPNE